MITPTVPWIKCEKKSNESETISSKRDKSMKALVIINFNSIQRDSIEQLNSKKSQITL